MGRIIKINIKGNYTLVPEGERVVTITSAKSIPSGLPKKIELTFTDNDTKGEIRQNIDLDNKTALFIFGLIVHYALGLEDGSDFDVITDTPKLIGKEIVVDVVHTEGSTPRDDGTYPKFANIKKILRSADNKPKEITENNTNIVNPRDTIINDL